MSKFIFFTDPHLRGNNPLSRKDNYPETALNKISWVVDYANSLDAAILCGGDWMQRPDTAPHVIAQLQRVLAKANNPVFTVLGNHDIYGYNPGTFFRTPLHILEAAHTIQRLSMEPILYRDASLTGIDAHYDLDHDGRTLDYTEVPDSNLVKIHIVHGFLAEHEWPQVPHTLLDNIDNTNADIILTGHEHSGYGISKRPGNKIFCNPGSLLRVTASVGDVNQKVKVAEITIENDEGSVRGKSFNVKLVPLPTSLARPAEEVIDQERLLLEKQAEKEIRSFSDNLGSFNLAPGRSPLVMLQEFAIQEQLEPQIVNEAKIRLEKAELELAAIRAKEKAEL